MKIVFFSKIQLETKHNPQSSKILYVNKLIDRDNNVFDQENKTKNISNKLFNPLIQNSQKDTSLVEQVKKKKNQ